MQITPIKNTDSIPKIFALVKLPTNRWLYVSAGYVGSMATLHFESDIISRCYVLCNAMFVQFIVLVQSDYIGARKGRTTNEHKLEGFILLGRILATCHILPYKKRKITVMEQT